MKKPFPFECPRCGKVSYNENDAAYGYCGHCHDWTGDEDRPTCNHPGCERLPHADDEHMQVEYREIAHHPFKQVHDNFAEHVKAGHMGLQSWTCDGCGAVQRMSQINGWYVEGECENCGYVTDLRKKGCNFTLMLLAGGAQRAELKKLLAAAGYKLPHDN